MPAGRPTKYKPEFCEQVIELGKKGKSLAQMAAHFDVARSTIDQWAEDQPDFSEALTRAKAHCQAWWENVGQEAMFMDKFQSAVWTKSMQARFRDDYTERQELKHEGGLNILFDGDDQDA
jgi:transposase-like protein